MVGQNFKENPNFVRIMAEGRGSFLGRSTIDREGRFYTFAQVGKLPLIIVVAFSADEVYRQWNHAAAVIGSMSIALCLGIGGVVFLLVRELKRQRISQNSLRELSLTDGLTNLSNRRHFEEIISNEIKLAARTSDCLSLLMIDVDHFKAYNDRFGHRRGDRMLRKIAETIHGSLLRPTDMAARYGGEEFAVVLPVTDVLGAMEVAERIRGRVSEQLPGEGEDQTTVSIGVASVVVTQFTSVDQLVEDADDALYAAKRAGRNRVSISCNSHAEFEAPSMKIA